MNLIKYTSIAAIFVSTSLIIAKILTYHFSHSIAILSSLVDSSLDLLTSLINCVAIFYAAKPKDEDHKFGHSAIEDIASFIQAMIIFISGILIIYQASMNIVNHKVITFEKVSMYTMLLSLFMTICLVLLQKYTISKTKSLVISADCLHYKTDVLMNIGIIASLFILKFTHFYAIDSIVAICIAVYIIYSAFELGKSAFNNLMGREISRQEQDEIIAIIQAENRIKGFHDFKTRRSGQMSFIQIHIEMKGDLTLFTAHEICEEIEQKITEKIPNCEIIIHKDPC
ncbi:cation diffusion facilitator family transporter [Candidatus Deianiraea vastatrix]|uniref:Protein p34 n=1 Tax=Candidatus Deianiraea vastatrix TaxID=2163644 RepID=A0A5B8XDC8_9RICK|nr:cation diffusion facilitator family transporter [Candidatus Deianiraea vastatrix]QED23369.1 Ferrous-iron efflux pump FieF [Candidatus Deianiraea vastatrix]